MTTRKARYQFAYRRADDQDRSTAAHHRVIVIGAGPVGLCAAIDLAQRGIPVLLLDESDRIGEGSRGISYAKRTLEIFDRLGVAQRCREKGVTWKVGKVFQGKDLLYAFDLLPEAGHAMPAFVNLQQYYLEHFLVERASEIPHLEVRWLNRVSAIERRPEGVTLTVETPDGSYGLDADWVIAADGARSTTRQLLGLDFPGEAFEDRFLISDVKMQGEFPTERWFWFDPPFFEGHSALLHKQPDDVWRIDLHLGTNADFEAEQSPERIFPRLERMLGHTNFTLEWVSVYTFQCRRLQQFVHGRVLFAGDAAHQVSPFGGRGANSGIQDAENMTWKLALVIRGEAPESLLDTYNIERSAAADENITHSTRSTDFIAPRSKQESRFRNAVLALARQTDFAKRMVNSGRLSTAADYATVLSTPDTDSWKCPTKPGAPLLDARMKSSNNETAWLLHTVGGEETVLHVQNGRNIPEIPGKKLIVIGKDLIDDSGFFAQRYDATPGATYLVRPDQHLAARWRHFDPSAIELASRRLRGHHHSPGPISTEGEDD
jgi:3-(3-hydroxy-phenyl)propionate hydroxylase